MSSIQIQEREYHTTFDGRLVHLEDWNEEIANALAEEENLKLTQDHWDVIYLMREYYNQYNISPVLKLLKKEISQTLGREKAKDAYLRQLFPGNVLVQGTKISGIPLAYLDIELDLPTASQATKVTKSTNASDEAQATKVSYGDTYFHLDANGYLIERNLWNPDIAELIAKREQVALSKDHWEILHYIRQFYFEYGVSPMVRLLIRHMKEVLGPEKSNRNYLYALFPQGPSRQGCRIAGLPEPRGCID